MEKSFQSSGECTITNSSSNQYLKQLNKHSHKISKPTTIPKKNPSSLEPQLQGAPLEAQSQPQQHQPPVYNINKNDFRDVVQKLTGSPAHSSPTLTNTPSTPSLILHPSRHPSSRLQRIRPPPLAQFSNRPPNLLSCAPLNNPQLFDPLVSRNPLPTASGFINRPPPPPGPPLSPLPPLPAVLAAAESPVTAYMRYLHNSISSNPLPQLQPPLPPPPSADHPQQAIAPPPQLPTPPVPFSFMNSPRAASSSFPILSPGLLLSPSSFPLSPTVALTSPKWGGL